MSFRAYEKRLTGKQHLDMLSCFYSCFSFIFGIRLTEIQNAEKRQEELRKNEAILNSLCKR